MSSMLYTAGKGQLHRPGHLFVLSRIHFNLTLCRLFFKSASTVATLSATSSPD
jgi:hypothetical protein